MLLTADGTLRRINQAGLTLLEKDSFNPIQPQNIYHQIDGEHQAAFREMLHAVFKGEFRRIEFRLIGLKGQNRWLYTHAAPLRDETGVIRLALMTSIDITERKEAEEALNELKIRVGSQELYSVLVEKAADGFWLLDKQFMTVYVNHAIEEMFGYRRDEMIGRSWYDFGDPEWVARAQELERRRESGVSEPHHFLFIHKNGRRVLTRIATTPLYDQNGDFNGALGILSDITRQKEADDALKIKDMLNAIAHSAGIGICIVNPDLTIAWYNQLYEQWFGSLEKTVGRNCFEVFERRNAICPECPALVSFETGHVATSEHSPITTAIGSDRIMALTASPIRNENGNILQIIEIVQDITERKRGERELAAANQRLRLATQAARMGIWDWDVPNNIMVWDDTMLKLYGLTPETYPGGVEAWQNGLHPEDREKTVAECQAALRGENEWDTEFRVTHPDGAVRRIKANGMVMRDSEGKAVRMLGVNYDITEQRELEEQLRQAQKMEVVGRLAGGVAHDFNNMLAVILGYTEMLKDKRPDGLDRTALDAIENAANRSKNLARQLLAFSRKQVISPKPQDLNALITESQKMLVRVIGEDVKLRFHLAADLGQVLLDPSQVDQILLNLAVNARDAMPDGGALAMTTENILLGDDSFPALASVVPGPYVMLSVQDTGHGMDKETRDHIFEPFFTTKGIGKGTGMGLATVYGIVKQNSGYISVESEPGQGATFKLYFPRISAKETKQPRTAIEPVPTGSGTILVVEDEDMVRELLTTMLERLGYKVLSAANAEKALATLGTTKDNPALLITDIVLPGMNGKELSNRLKQTNPGIKVLFISGYTAEVIASKDVQEEGVNFLPKPFTMTEVARKVQEVLGGSS